MQLERALEVLSERIGPFHLITFPIISIPYVFQALFYLSYVFTTMRSEFRCFIPECEAEDEKGAVDMRPPWLELATPAPHASQTVDGRCWRFAPVPAPAASGANGSCSALSFSSTLQPCERWVYPNKHLSIMTEWDITCYSGSDYQLTMVGTINNAGRMLGLPLSGYFSDRYGRRAALLAEMAVSGALGIIRSFSTNYIFFTSIEFLDPIFYDGIGGAAFIMGMELIPTQLRGAWSALSHVIFAVGLVLLGGLAWAVPYWRWLLRAMYSAALLSLPLIWLLPESVHWLVSKGRVEDAQQVIQKAANMNKVVSEELNFDKVRLSMPSQREGPNDNSSLSAEFHETLRSKILMLRLLNCCIIWIMVMFVYDGLSVYSVSMSGNPYVNFMVVVLVEVPASLISWGLLSRVGRRPILSGAMLLAAISSLAYHFLPADVTWYRVIAVMVAKLSVTIAFTVLYVLTVEIFPTRVRHTLYSVCSTLGRMGSLLAPQAPLLALLLPSLPLIVFGCAALGCALLALALPETASAKLPDTVRDAEALGPHRALSLRSS